MNTIQEEELKQNSGIVTIAEKVNIEPLSLVNLDKSVLYAWLLSLGYHYDSELREWLVDIFPRNA